MTETTIALVLLVKNELEPLKVVLPKVDTSLFDDVLCIDGHSTDGSVEYLESQGIRVIRQREMGRGKAVIESIEHTEKDALLFFSPDGNEDTRDLQKLVDIMKQTKADLVIASRFTKGSVSDDSDDPYKIRRVGNMFFSRLARLFWGGQVTDAINGFRLIKKSVLKQINQDATGYNIEIQQTIRCLKLRKKVLEIPTIELERVGPAKQSPTYKMGIQFSKVILSELLMGTKFLTN
ncbi:MAG: glycosyltransferase family 2 protein [Candidatus Thorarchaeota archaeon]|jgi:glycosyltransferase involved in cell wall biosynthesis